MGSRWVADPVVLARGAVWTRTLEGRLRPWTLLHAHGRSFVFFDARSAARVASGRLDPRLPDDDVLRKWAASESVERARWLRPSLLR